MATPDALNLPTTVAREPIINWRTDLGYWLGRNPVTAVGMAVVVLLVLMATFAPLLAPYDPFATDPRVSSQPPSWSHPFGTGPFGEDILSRVMYGARYDLAIAFGAVGIALVLGCLIGAVAGFWGGLFDDVLMRVVELLQAFPQFVLAMAIAGALGPSFLNLIIAIAVTNIPIYAHLMRVRILSIKGAQFAVAAASSGNSRPRILYRHLLPNSLAPIFVQSTLQPGWAILSAAGLSFIGLGIRLPAPEWGLMVAAGSSRIISGQWWISLFPGLFIVLAVMAFNLIGDGLQDLLDPQRKST
ncbi:MAG: ABC transporter permease [Chloroflexota bacterium]|nr:ABC transporter permease [Chloroflexota bacterium]